MVVISKFRRQIEEERRALCERLRLAREDAGLTQVEAAARLGIEQSIISRIETGERRLDVAELIAIAEAYGKNPCRMILGHKNLS
ncbi:helix-turn-helix protein [compost metagenome]